MRQRWLAIAVAFAACGGRAGRHPQATLTFARDGKAVEMTSAVAMHFPDGSLYLVVSNRDLSCADLVEYTHGGTRSGDIGFAAELAPRLAPDGTMTWQLASIRSDESIQDGELAVATISGAPALGKSVEVSFEYVLDADGHRAEVSGTTVAVGCGEAPNVARDVTEPKAPHRSTAVMTIAGQKVPIVTAWRDRESTHFSSEPATCPPFASGSRVTLVGAGTTWTLAGGWFQNASSTTTGELNVVTGARGDGLDGPTVELDLSGSAKVGDYPVELSGSIEALECREQ